MEPLSLGEAATQPLEGVPGGAITREAAGAPSAAGEGVPTYQSLHTGNDYPSAGPITAASPGQKQARIKERTEASYPASNHPLALRARGLSTPPPSHPPPTRACQSGA